jgi:hypothetical protein
MVFATSRACKKCKECDVERQMCCGLRFTDEMTEQRRASEYL